MKNIISYINLAGILLILYLMYNSNKDQSKTIHSNKIEYIGDTIINYNEYKSKIIHNFDTTLIINNYITKEGDTVKGITVHQYGTNIKDDTLQGTIMTLTDGNIYEQNFTYQLNPSLFEKRNPFQVTTGLDIGRNMIQPNIMMGKRFKLGIGYNLQNDEIILKSSYTLNIKRKKKFNLFNVIK